MLQHARASLNSMAERAHRELQCAPVWSSNTHAPSPWNLENRSTVKKVTEFLSVKGRRRNQKFQVRSEVCNVFHKSKQNVGVERALVSFVHHDHRVVAEVGLGQELTQKHPVCHVQQLRLG